MLDTYREKEQRGARCTVTDDGVRVEWPCGSVYEYWSGGVRFHGPKTFLVTLHVRGEPRSGGWWQRLRWWLWPLGAGKGEK
jgi:hypothetical protein